MALVVIVLVTGLPLLMSVGGMSTCADCGTGLLLAMTCVAVLTGAVVLLPALLRSRLRRRDRSLRLALFAAVFDRPPQLV